MFVVDGIHDVLAIYEVYISDRQTVYLRFKYMHMLWMARCVFSFVLTYVSMYSISGLDFFIDD